MLTPKDRIRRRNRQGQLAVSVPDLYRKLRENDQLGSVLITGNHPFSVWQAKKRLTVEQNAVLLEEIAQETSKSLDDIRTAILKNDERLSTSFIVKIFHQHWEQGEPVTFSYLTKTLGLAETVVGRIAQRPIEVEQEQILLRDLLYDDFVIAGKSLQEIASAIGSTHRQRADQYLRGTGQYEKWEAMKEVRKEQEIAQKMELNIKLNSSRQQLLEVLVAKMVEETKNDWPLQTALRMYRERSHDKPDSYSMEKLVELFEWYEYAVEQDDLMRLEDFSTETKLPITSISDIFAEVGIQPLRRRSEKGYVKQKIKLSEPEKQRIQKGLMKTCFSSVDLGYFLRLPFWNIQQNSPGAKHRKLRHNYGILYFSYKIASEIYEARSSMSDEKIQQGLGLQDHSYAKYLQHQPEISRDIVKGLRAIYSEKATYVRKPFVPPEIRHLQQQETFEAIVVDEVRNAIRQGAKGVFELQEKTGHSIETIQKYASRAGIELPRSKREDAPRS